MAMSCELERQLASALGLSAANELIAWCRKAGDQLTAQAAQIESLTKTKADKPDKPDKPK